MIKTGRPIARAAAMCLLFQYSVTGDPSIETVSVMSDALSSDNLTDKNKQYIEDVLRLFLEHETEIDEIINKYSYAWKSNRIPKVDFAIMRLALTEIAYIDSIPYAVSANEAVELAKEYSTENSPRFINGLLGSYIAEVNSSNE